MNIVHLVFLGVWSYQIGSIEFLLGSLIYHNSNNPLWFWGHCLALRTLDSDLNAVMKAADSDFDWKRISFVLEAGSNNFNLCASDIIKLVVGPRCSLHTVAGWLMNGMSFLEQDFGWKGSSKTSWVHTHAHLYTALIHKKAHKPK